MADIYIYISLYKNKFIYFKWMNYDAWSLLE